MKHKIFLNFLQDESGATAIEYGLLAAIIAIGIIVSLDNVGNVINNFFVDTSNAMANATVAPSTSSPSG